MEEKKYTIELTENQLELLKEATEFSARFICDQVNHTYWISQARDKDFASPEWREKANQVDKKMNEVKKLWWDIDGHGNNGIGYNKNADALFDMYQVIRHQLWKDDENQDKSTTSNQSYPASKYSPEPLIIVEKCPIK